MDKLAYQLQINGSKHLIRYELDGKHFRFIPFIPNLKIPVIKSKRLEKEIDVGVSAEASINN